MVRQSCRVGALAALLTAACAVTDTTPPEAPSFDDVPATTSHATLLLAGRAEPGATLLLRREPAFPADFKVPAPVADPSTARFSVQLPLVAGRLNKFFAKAQDAAGLVGPESETAVTQGDAAVDGVLAVLEDPRVRIGTEGSASVKVRAQVRLSDPSDSRRGHAVRFELAGYPVALPPVLADTDAAGVASAVFKGLTKLGAGRVVVTGPVPPGVPTDLAPRDSVPFEVIAGEPSSATLRLSATVGTTPVSGTAITVPAGAEVRATVAARDAANNVVSAPWVLTTSPSDAFVTGGVVRFERAGTYEVNAFVQRSDLLAAPRATASVVVTPDVQDSTRVRLLVTLPPETTSGTALPIAAKVVDGYGNALPIKALTATSSDPLATFDPARPALTLVTAGEATITVRATRTDDAIVSSGPIPLLVRPGPAGTLALTLDGQSAPLSSPRGVPPGTELLLGATARDAAGNVIANAPVEFSPDLGVDVFGRTVFAPATPGLYVVNAIVAGTGARALAAFQVVTAAPDRIEVSCPETAVAGVAFACSATVRDRYGNPLAGTVGWSVTPTAGAEIQGARLTLTTAGAVTVKASAAGFFAAPVERTVTVLPAAPSQVRLTLTPAIAKVGQSVAAATSVVDAFGNLHALPVLLTTDAPDAVTNALGVTNLTTPGTWRVFAQATDPVTRTTLHVNATLTLSAEAPASVQLALSPASAVVGSPVRVLATARDPYGNSAAGEPAITVDGAPPDQRRVLLDGSTLTFLVAGAFHVTATLGSSSASAWIDVRPTPDTTAPVLAISLDRMGTGSAAPVYKPGENVSVAVRARDDRALAGVRVRASSADLGLVYDQVTTWEGPRAEADETFTIPLPATRIGALTVTAVATDLGGNSASTAPVPATSDFHFDRLAIAGTTVTARTVSVAPALGTASGLAFGGTTLYASTLGAPAGVASAGSVTSSIGAGGVPTTVWSYGDEAFPVGLASVPTSGAPYLFTATGHRTTRALNMLRLPPGLPSPQRYGVPPIGTATVSLDTTGPILRGLAADVRSATPRVYLAQVAETEAATPAGALWSFVAKTTAVASVNPTNTAEALTSPLVDHRPEAVCVADVANPTELFFTGTRFDRGGNTAFAGLYRVTLQTTGSSGNLMTGQPEVVVEEPRDPSAGRVVYGPCVHVPGTGTAARLVFSRWVRTAGGATTAGKVSQVARPCTGACTTTDLVSGSTSPLGALTGLARGVTGAAGGTAALWVLEGDASRIFRLDGVF